jgi:nucleoside-diphosphate-sugar epimerase
MIKNVSKVIVTGGAGFIGSHIAAACVAQGFEVHIIDDLSLGKEKNIPSAAVFHKMDIRDKEKIEDLFSSLGEIHCVFHCAAIPMVQFSINGTVNILHTSQKNKIRRLVYSGSCSAYGDQEESLFTEDMGVSPKSPYALQKYFGEVACSTYYRVYGLPTVSFRYFNVYGPGQDSTNAYAMVISKFISQTKEHKPMTVTGDGKQTRDFVFIDDIVRANMRAMESERVGKGEVINLGSGKSVSVYQITQIIGGEVLYVPARIEPKNAQANISLAKQLLEWEPTISLEEGIEILKKYE